MYGRGGSRFGGPSGGPSSSMPFSLGGAPVPRPSSNIGDGHFKMMGRKRHFDEDDCLEEEDDGSAYLPAPGSPGPNDPANDEDDDDPLDAFMAGIEVQAKKDKQASEKHKTDVVSEKKEGFKKKDKLGRTDIEEEDMQESYFNWMEENKMGAIDEEEEFDYDEEGNVIIVKKPIDPLPALDHSTVNYEAFHKNFYIEHSDIAHLDVASVSDLRKKLGVTVTGISLPKPVSSFAHFGFDEKLMNFIRKSEYSQPTPIQAQGIPIALSGRDMIGIAKTGSGKTAAYLWPALVHIMDQRELIEGDGPIALICVPTRELAIQVYNEARKFGKAYDLRVVCAYGGGSKWEQSKALQEGAEIVVATPGRMIDMVKIEATNLTRTTFLVFDEADRMFDLGFEAQVRSIADHVRPDRQCLMFSATFKKKVERLARHALNDPIRVVQGEIGEDIDQYVEVLSSGPDKWAWLTDRLVSFCALGKVLIFVTKKLNCDELATNLKARDFKLGVLHGDMMQHERNEVLSEFRKPNAKILVATDVAARGLDIPNIKTVVNYDIARDIDTHVHRIGRTGRAGEKGTAYTLVTEADKEFAGHLVRNLESVNQNVPHELMILANQSSWFRNSRFKNSKGKKIAGVGGRGLGYQEKGAPPLSIKAPSFKPPTCSAYHLDDMMPQKESVGSSRLNAVKSAFKSSFQHHFHGASQDTYNWEKAQIQVDETKTVGSSNNTNADTDANSRRKKKSRWE